MLSHAALSRENRVDAVKPLILCEREENRFCRSRQTETLRRRDVKSRRRLCQMIAAVYDVVTNHRKIRRLPFFIIVRCFGADIVTRVVQI